MKDLPQNEKCTYKIWSLSSSNTYQAVSAVFTLTELNAQMVTHKLKGPGVSIYLVLIYISENTLYTKQAANFLPALMD